MNFEKALYLLQQALSDYSNFVFHEKFSEELYTLLGTVFSGNEEKFFKKFVSVLACLSDHGENIHLVDSHEKLAHVGDSHVYYSLHIKTAVANIRMLISFIDSKPVFLVCFNEKSGKRKSGYESFTETMISRRKELEDVHNE